MTVKINAETEAAIRARAHEIWEAEGRPHGRDEIHWRSAYDAIVKSDPVAPVKIPKAKPIARKK